MNSAADIILLTLTVVGLFSTIGGILFAITYVIAAMQSAKDAHRRIDNVREDICELLERTKEKK